MAAEYDEVVKKAQQQPGIAELMKAYGRYDELVKRANAYLSRPGTKVIISTSNSSSQ